MSADHEKHRILLVEDHRILREGLRALLNAAPQFEVVGEAGDGLEAIAQTRKLQPDLVIMDLSMPKMTGLEALREITRHYPKVKVLALTMHDSEEHLRDALRAGAAGYLLKSASHGELLAAVRGVLAGQRYLSPLVARPVIDGYLEKTRPPEVTAWDTLTTREREVLKLIAEGYKSREIADQLCISQSTVELEQRNGQLAVKRIVEKHGGQRLGERRRGGGRFCFSLPSRSAPVAVPATSRSTQFRMVRSGKDSLALPLPPTARAPVRPTAPGDPAFRSCPVEKLYHTGILPCLIACRGDRPYSSSRRRRSP